MSNPLNSFADRAAQLRADFDHSFAKLPEPRISYEDLLGIRIEDDRYALNLGEVSRLLVDVKVTSIPTKVSGLLGIAGFRGAIFPVYNLEQELGYPQGDLKSLRWTILTRSKLVLGLMFSNFDGHLRVPSDNIQAADSQKKNLGPLARVAHFEGSALPIIDLSKIADKISNRVQSYTPTKK